MRTGYRKTDLAIDDLLKWTVILGGGYLAFKALQTVVAVGEGATTVIKGTGKVLNSVGSAIGSGLFDLFWPESDQVGDMLYYTVTFPDGARHAIASSKVSSDGKFSYGGSVWQLVTEKTTGKRFATKWSV